MVISWVIIFLYYYFAVSNYEKAVLAAFPISLLFTTVPLVSIGSTVIPLNMGIFLMLMTLYYIYDMQNDMVNPYYVPIIVICVGFVLVAVCGAYHSSLFLTFGYCFHYLILLLLWPFLRNRDDMSFFVNVLVIVFLIITSYSVIEFVLQDNIWMEWLLRNWQTDADNAIYVSHMDDIRFGFGRCSSFFHFPIPFGDACAIFLVFFLYWNTYTSIKTPTFLFIVTIVMLLVGITLSNSRAPIIVLVIGCLGLIRKDYIVQNKYLIIILSFLLLYGGYYYIKEVLLSVTGSASENVGGSTMDMRLVQFLYCLNEFVNNPWFGGGFNRMTELQDPNNRELMGGESHIFVLMVNQGLCGIITYFYCVWYSVKVFPKKYRLFPMIFITSWVVGAMVSLTTGLYLTYPMILLLLLYRANKLGLLSSSAYSFTEIQAESESDETNVKL